MESNVIDKIAADTAGSAGSGFSPAARLAPIRFGQFPVAVAIAFSILAGCLTLVGWMLDIEEPGILVPGFAPMKPATASSFVLAGLSLWALLPGHPNRYRRWLGRSSAVVITVIAVATLSQDIRGWNLAVDPLLIERSPAVTLASGRMSPATASNLALLGVALLLLNGRSRLRLRAGEALALLSGIHSLLALAGHALGIDLYGSTVLVEMDVGTAVTSLMLCAGVLLSLGDRGLISGLIRSGARLSTRLAALVLMTVLVSGGIVGALLIHQSRDLFYEQIVAGNVAAVDFAAEFASSYVESQKSTMELFASRPSLRQAVASGRFHDAAPELQTFLRLSPQIDACSLFDTKGINRASGIVSARNIGGYSGDREWFQETMKTGKPFLGLPTLSRATGRPNIPYSVPILDNQGEVQAIFVGGISLGVLSDAITKFQTGRSSRTSLLDLRGGGVLLAHPDRKRILTPSTGRNKAVDRLLKRERGAMETADSNGKPSLIVYAPVPRLPWGVLIIQPSQAALAPLSESLREGIFIVAAVLLGAALAGGWSAHYLTRPIAHLRQAANALAAGDLDQRVHFTRKDELGDLGRGFDHMAAALAEHRAQLEAAYQDLQRQNRLIQKANRMKSEFLANMSHELRTPLNGIIGFAEMMHDEKLGPVSEPHKEYLGDILVSARHLLQLINDVLDLAKVEAGKLEFQPEPVEIGKLLREACDIVRTLAAKKELKIEIDVKPEIGSVALDPAKFKQVLYNYLSNAIKFTPEGGRIAVRALPHGPRAFRLEVEDTGFGIAPGDIASLFLEFQQLDATLARKFQGTGLGLALTKKIVEAQGGSVGVTSTPGVGSTFFATLPRRPDAESINE